MRLVKVLIWLGFAALLAVSVPKVAWLVHSYEGAGGSVAVFTLPAFDPSWIVPYAVALCVDALILALTYAVSQDTSRASQAGMWAFVMLLSLFSGYCNLVYNAAHAPAGTVWGNPLVGLVAPVLLALIPLFALCYTLILSRIDGTAETLVEKAVRLRLEQDAKATIARVKQEQRTARFVGMIATAKEVKNALIDTPEKPAETPDDSTSPPVDQNPEKNEGEAVGKTVEDAGENAGTSPQENEGDPPEVYAASNITRLPTTGRLSVSVKEAARLLNLSESYVRDLKKNGALKCAPRNTKLITVSSIERYQKTRKKPGQVERGLPPQETEEIPAISS